jgi:eukaryotic-like serine/threonine-protein kinase
MPRDSSDRPLEPEVRPSDTPHHPADLPEVSKDESRCDSTLPFEQSPSSGEAIAQVGPYKLLAVLGEGGFGTVYLAEQEHPVKRRVAVKVVKAGMDTKQVLARFEAERQALAIMDHPNIAKVFDAGTTATGRSYFVMELMHGEPITAYCDRVRLTLEERLTLFTPICQAVQHAHHKGIIHRDIKPSNILVTIVDEHPLPKIIDFGLAKAMAQPLTQQTIFTEQGQLIGTPEYISPEQAEMTSLDIDTRSDIYSLGVLLYELLTGALPFDRHTLRQAGFEAIRRLIREVEPPKPSTKLSLLREKSSELAEKRRLDPVSHRKHLRRELDWIVMKALEKDRTRRYATALAFSEDIQRYLANEPVVAGPPSGFYRLRKLVRRYRVPLAMGLALIALLVSITVLATVSYFREAGLRIAAESASDRAATAATEAGLQRKRAEDEAEKARTAQRYAERQNYYTTIRLASARLDAGHSLGVPEMLRGCQQDLRGWEWGYLMSRCPRAEWEFRAHQGPVSAIAVVPDGRTFVTAGADGKLILWDATTRKLLWERKVRSKPKVRSLSTDAQGKILLAEFPPHYLVCDVSTGKLICAHNDILPKCCCLSADGQRLYAAVEDANQQVEIRAYSTKDWQVVRSAKSKRTIDWLAVGADEKRLLAMDCYGDHVTAYDAQGLKPVADSATYRFPCQPVVDEKTGLAVYRAWRFTMLWNPDEKLSKKHQVEHEQPVAAVAFDPIRRTVASCGQNGEVLLIAADTKAELGRIEQGQGVRAGAFLGDGLLLGDREGVLRYWKATRSQTADAPQSLPGEIGAALAFRGDGKVLAVFDMAGGITLWDTETWNSKRNSIGVSHMQFFSFQPRTNHLAVAFDDGIRFHDTSGLDLKEVRRIPTRFKAVSGCFNQTGKRLVINYDPGAGHRGGALVIDCENEKAEPIRVFDMAVWQAVISPDGTTVAAVECAKGRLRVWDLCRQKETFNTQITSSTLLTGPLAFHPDGTLLASCNDIGSILLWDTRLGRLIRVLSGHTEHVTSLSFSPDGRRLVSGGADLAIHVWDWELGQDLLRLRNKIYDPLVARFSPDGLTLANTEADGARVRRALPWTDETPLGVTGRVKPAR